MFFERTKNTSRLVETFKKEKFLHGVIAIFRNISLDIHVCICFVSAISLVCFPPIGRPQWQSALTV